MSIWGIPAPVQFDTVMPFELGLAVAAVLTFVIFFLGYFIGKYRGYKKSKRA